MGQSPNGISRLCYEAQIGCLAYGTQRIYDVAHIERSANGVAQTGCCDIGVSCR